MSSEVFAKDWTRGNGQPEKREITGEIFDAIKPYELAYNKLIQSLQGTKGVHAVAFLEVCPPELKCRPLFSVAVFNSCQDGTEETRKLTEEVTDAHAAFFKAMLPLVDTGLSFVRMDGEDLDSVRRRMIKQWSEEPGLNLIDFVPLTSFH